VDRVIFTIINKGLIKEDKHFEEDIGKTYLNSEGRRIFVKHFEEKLSTTFKHRKYLLEEQTYQPFAG
jgi:CRISPR-associated protein Cas1